MKRWMIIGLSVLVLVFLAFNAIRKKVNRAKDAREWYVGRLGYRFSGKVDSVYRISNQKGFITFHTSESIDHTIEDYLNTREELKGREMRFLMFSPARKITIFTLKGASAAAGDSIYVDSESDQIAVFREGEKISEWTISSSLRGRPF